LPQGAAKFSHLQYLLAEFSVVNIGNGFGAACIASLINHL